ncbi:hypothetical protein Glove_309g98 [Diversispora epigaea]|uniref:Uncharacterized protein n=1 Tax=Diversispora epigaea TaxID=1348612 RepID=A0A397HS89_9GLOM|nr:hypothetical protein Glove_309g98 [Diversispora epigaea]
MDNLIIEDTFQKENILFYQYFEFEDIKKYCKLIVFLDFMVLLSKDSFLFLGFFIVAVDVNLLHPNLLAKLFIELFKEHSKSELQFPKLHSWVFHICSSIREFGAINGYTTETYESLHKDYVKKPYKLTNKKEIEKQIMKIIRRKAIITESSSKEIPKTPIALKYSKKLYEFCIQNAEIYIQTRMNDPDLEKEMKLGFEKFLDNIAVKMNADEIFEYTSDNGVCFAQVLLITEIIINYEKPMHLALM